ncbi:MAG: threonine synthase [Dehalococcoidia bacterium]|nr:MAG: threonine synthase [Dehalococcoidia bacterium]
MSNIRGLHCRECGREYPIAPTYFCEFCFGPLEVSYDYAAIARQLTRDRIISRPLTMWRYRELLPVASETVIEINTGFTPLVEAKNLARRLGLERLYLKNDCVNPTYSFKDRVVSVAVTKALEFGFDTIACASTGNLAMSVAAHAARAGKRAVVFIPSDLELGKIYGALVFNPLLVAIEGTYDDVNRLCSEIADSYPWAFVNINLRPYYAEGSKTLAFETAEQLGWQAPDQVVVPMASGSLFTKIWKGFNELAQIGLIPPRRPRMWGAQAAGCSPIATAYAQRTFTIRPVHPNTIAKSLAIGNPADGYYALKTMEESGGGAAAVPDEAIIEGIKLLAETEGIFAETAGGGDHRRPEAPGGARRPRSRRDDRCLPHGQRPQDDGSARWPAGGARPDPAYARCVPGRLPGP